MKLVLLWAGDQTRWPPEDPFQHTFFCDYVNIWSVPDGSMANPMTKLVCWTSQISSGEQDQHPTWCHSASVTFLRPQFRKVFKHTLNIQLLQLLNWYPHVAIIFWICLRYWVIVAVDRLFLCQSQQWVGKFIKMKQNKVVDSIFKSLFIILMSLTLAKKTGSLQLSVFMLLRGHCNIKIHRPVKLGPCLLW